MIAISRVRSVPTAAALLLMVAPAVGEAQNHAPNPYDEIDGWAKMPAGRQWGATSAVHPAADGRHIWVAERCEANSCVGRDDLDPVLLFDPDGNLVRSFGAGLLVWPHGIEVDADGNVWVTDARGEGGRQAHPAQQEDPRGGRDCRRRRASRPRRTVRWWRRTW